MTLNIRILAMGAAVIGLALGGAFGAGVAYGHGNKPASASSCCTAQQLQTLTGISVNTSAASQGASGTPSAANGRAVAGGAGAAAANASGNNTGRITAVDSSSLTIETRQGSLKINLSPTTTFNKITAGSANDLSNGLTVLVTGTKKDDGSIDAASLTQLPPELQALIGTGGATASSTPTTGR
jgi:hypothetical protein